MKPIHYKNKSTDQYLKVSKILIKIKLHSVIYKNYNPLCPNRMYPKKCKISLMCEKNDQFNSLYSQTKKEIVETKKHLTKFSIHLAF